MVCGGSIARTGIMPSECLVRRAEREVNAECDVGRVRLRMDGRSAAIETVKTPLL